MAFTYFFRDMQTLEMIREHGLPNLSAKVLDAGCAMAPEPYSTAIIVRENMGQMILRNVKIHATDIGECSHFGEIVREGVYSEELIKRIPDNLRSKYFTKNSKPGFFEISGEAGSCKENSKVCTSYAYLVLDTLNVLQTVNTLADVVRDPLITDNIIHAPGHSNPILQGSGGSVYMRCTCMHKIKRRYICP
jgi:hypothetical protein